MCWCISTKGQVWYIHVHAFWFLASSKPGRHSHDTPPLPGASLQMWAQPWSLFMQFIPSVQGIETDGHYWHGKTAVKCLAVYHQHWHTNLKLTVTVIDFLSMITAMWLEELEVL